MRKLSSRENGGKDGSINYGVMENICNYNKAEYARFYGIPYVKNATKRPCDKNKSPKEGSNYCREHGCRVCGYANLKWKYQNHSSDEKLKDIQLRLELGKESVCSLNCKAKADTKYFWEEARKSDKKQIQAKLLVEITNLDYKLNTEIRSIFSPFYDILSGTSINDLKLQLIREEIEKQEFINKVHICIDNLSLESAEKKQWKEIYSESSLVDLVLLVNKEREFLLSLTQKKLKEEAKEQIEKQEIVKEIKTELDYFSPQVNLKELPETYHNFESLKTKELRKVKVKIIEATKNKREEKKLSAFLDKATSCVDNELRNFITGLEKFTSTHASQYEKNAYYSQKSKVDQVIDSLKRRWNSLDEEAKLSYLWDNACHDFDDWIKEGENLVLSDNCPFFNFKEDIKNFCSESEIKNEKNKAFHHVIEKYKKDVKKQLGAEEWDNEYQEIDSCKDFSMIKLARDNVWQGRKKSLEEFIEGAISKLQNLLDSNQEVDLSKIVLPTWKEDLRDLKSKNEVSAFVKKIEEEINNASRAKKYRNQQEGGPNSNRAVFTHWKIVIVIISLVFFLVTLIKLFKKTKKLSI